MGEKQFKMYTRKCRGFRVLEMEEYIKIHQCRQMQYSKGMEVGGCGNVLCSSGKVSVALSTNCNSSTVKF